MCRRAVALALLLAVAACRPPPPRLAPPPAPPAAQDVVVLVPGITGVTLTEKATGRLVWGTGLKLFFPRDRGRSLAGELVPGELIEEMDVLGVVRKEVYGPVLAHLEAAGLVRGDLRAPRPGETLFTFAYDWRQDNVLSARELATRLEALRPLVPGRALRVSLLCQSNGGQICRWLAKYGKADLEEAAAGEARPLEGVEISRLVLIGTANGGSLRTLRFLDRGRRYARVGRLLAAETLALFPSLYQDLPAYSRELFVEAQGRPLEVDVFDAASWRKYGWSFFRQEPTAANQALAAALPQTLASARRFHDLLRADSPTFSTPSYATIQSRTIPTPARAWLRQTKAGWQTLYPGDRALQREPRIAAKTVEPGDEHATAASQEWLSPQELAALAGGVFEVHGAHFEMILTAEALGRVVGVLGGG